MSEPPTHPTDPGVPLDVARGTERSTLFWFLHERHAELASLWRGRRVSWGAVSAWAAGLGGLDRTGKPASANTAKKTWSRVCAAKAREPGDG